VKEEADKFEVAKRVRDQRLRDALIAIAEVSTAWLIGKPDHGWVTPAADGSTRLSMNRPGVRAAP